MNYADLTARADSGAFKSPPPGKFEGNGDVVLARMLYDATLEGWCEEEKGSVEYGSWFGRVGRFVVEEESNGFFTYRDCGTDDAAHEFFATLPDES